MGKRFVIGLLALCLLSFCVQLALYPSLPETVRMNLFFNLGSIALDKPG